MVRALFILGLTALFLVSAFTPPSSVLSKDLTPLPVQFVKNMLASAEPPVWTRTRPLYRFPDTSLALELDKVAWAIKREDLRSCGELSTSSSDLLMLCIAAVQKDSSRCNRIADSSLRSLCHEVVAS